MERQKLHVLVVVAHPHDFMHCSGTCGIHTSIGDTVTIVSLWGIDAPQRKALHRTCQATAGAGPRHCEHDAKAVRIRQD